MTVKATDLQEGDYTVAMDGDIVTIRARLLADPQPSGSGKSMTLFSTHGIDRRSDLGHDYLVGLTIGKAV